MLALARSQMDQHFLADFVSPVTALSLGTAGFSQTPTCPGYVLSLGGQLFYAACLLHCRVCVRCHWYAARKRARSQMDQQHFLAEFVSNVTVLTLG